MKKPALRTAMKNSNTGFLTEDRKCQRENVAEREMGKNDFKPRSVRKPLGDVTNGMKSSKPVKKKKKSPKNEDRKEDEALDRLLLVQSDLSSLIHQIDEVVVQAFKQEAGKQERKEIESFTNDLSEFHSSLKSRVLRFQKSLSTPSMESENHNQSRQPLTGKSSPAVQEDEIIDSPDETKFDSLVSPSPLVSWRANCTVERSRQMFLLTPLPMSKALSSVRDDSSESFLERINSNTNAGLPSFISILGDTNDDLLEGVSVKPTPSKTLNSSETETGNTLEHGFVSPSNFSRRCHSMLVMTPCLKMSPPKSCVLLEPISESSPEDKYKVRKSTPFHVGIQNSSGSEISPSSSQASENLALKYPELVGIQPAHKLGIGKKEVEESMDWLMSPPKTCVLMEPAEEKSMNNAAANGYQLPRPTGVFNQQMNFNSTNDNDVRGDCHLRPLRSSFAPPESTPIWKEPESTIRTGMRPGENTLKKELWTRFEAASTNEFLLNLSLLEKTDQNQKGFLDRLDEVSCDETSPVAASLR